MPDTICGVTEVWWIRHGESDSNAGASTVSGAAPVLTELGWAQARSMLSLFDQAPDLLVTSPYIRTKQTAQPLLEHFPSLLQEEWPVQEFDELSYANRNHSNRAERLPKVEAFWERSDPDYCDGEGAESFRSLLARVDATIERMQHLARGRTVIFSHGLFIRAIIWQLWRNSTEISHQTMRAFIYFYMALPLPNCAILRFQLGLDGRWLMAQPDISHLSLVTAQPGVLDP